MIKLPMLPKVKLMMMLLTPRKLRVSVQLNALAFAEGCQVEGGLAANELFRIVAIHLLAQRRGLKLH